MYEYTDVIIRRGSFKTVQFNCIRVFHYPGAFLVGLFLRNISNENLGEFFQNSQEYAKEGNAHVVRA